MNCVICAIAKKENAYINEWCHHHLNIGFDHIYIYDNNDLDYPDIKQYISKDIRDKVTFFDIRGKKPQQNDRYTEFYKKYNHDFDWCAFIDVDEFIILNRWNNIHYMCNDTMFKDVDFFTLTWHLYNDSEIIDRDEKIPVMNSFTHTDLFDDWTHKQQKYIISNHLADFSFNDEYFSSKKFIDCDGNRTNCGWKASEYTKNAWINHYCSKSLTEFLKYKYTITDALGNDNIHNNWNYYYFKRCGNIKTPVKLAYLKSKGIKIED